MPRFHIGRRRHRWLQKPWTLGSADGEKKWATRVLRVRRRCSPRRSPRSRIGTTGCATTTAGFSRPCRTPTANVEELAAFRDGDYSPLQLAPKAVEYAAAFVGTWAHSADHNFSAALGFSPTSTADTRVLFPVNALDATGSACTRVARPDRPRPLLARPCRCWPPERSSCESLSFLFFFICKGRVPEQELRYKHGRFMDPRAACAHRISRGGSADVTNQKFFVSAPGLCVWKFFSKCVVNKRQNKVGRSHTHTHTHKTPKEGQEVQSNRDHRAIR